MMAHKQNITPLTQSAAKRKGRNSEIDFHMAYEVERRRRRRRRKLWATRYFYCPQYIKSRAVCKEKENLL